MSGEIIRLGDRTSHGGVVIEGSATDICMGKPISFIGHKVFCPLCKGAFPIVEGASNATFYGKGVALAGMHTACGAVLIATQFTDRVHNGRGSAPATTRPGTGQESSSQSASGRLDLFDDRFLLLDEETRQPLCDTEYAIRRASGKFEHGVTDSEGYTHLLSSTSSAEVIEIYV